MLKVRAWSLSKAGQLRFLLCLCLLNNEGKGNVFHVLLTVSGSSCPAFDCRCCSSMQRELSLSTPTQKQKQTSVSQRVHQRCTTAHLSQPLQTIQGAWPCDTCRQCPKKKESQTGTPKQRERFQLFFHHPFIGCAYQGVKQGAKQCAA